MVAFRNLETPAGALGASLGAGLQRVRLLPRRIQKALGAPLWEALSVSSFFPWLEFVDRRALVTNGEPERSLAAVLVRQGDGTTLLAALELVGGTPRLLRVRAGAGVQALITQLATLEEQGGAETVALASERELGSLGWLVIESSGQRRFLPAFPGRFKSEHEGE